MNDTKSSTTARSPHNIGGSECGTLLGADARLGTGLCDSNGAEISVGDTLKKTVNCNQEFHGSWAIYEVKQQGIVPILSYVRSEKGEMLPPGYLASTLSDEYDQKNFVFANESRSLRPIEQLEVVST